MLTLIILFICSISAEAQNEGGKQKTDSITLTGKIFDRMTSHHIIDTTVEILDSDSTILNSTKGGERSNKARRKGDSFEIYRDSNSNYTIKVPKIEGNYLIKVSKDGYEPYYMAYDLKFKKRDFEKEIPDIYLGRQKVKVLEEVTVKASKVKFYHKGDTIVYNADAFSLPEGSMLDALVEQMPGVQIRDGKIYVNGQFVESLLLNGKDFFKGNQNVLMKNIGAYAVKDIAVYEKKDELELMLGDRADISKELVMDVRLKKDFMTGYMINAEVGGGTHSRYLGRLFAMQYTNNSRLSIYGNANNINKRENLSDSNTEFTITDNEGIKQRIKGGIDYNVDNSLHTWEASGNVEGSYLDSKNDVVTNAVNYLQTSDTYDFSDKNIRSRKFSLSTEHDFKVKKTKWNMSLKPKFSYNKNRDNDETVAATFNKEMQDLNSEIIRAIYSNDNKALRDALINRNLKIYESNEHGYDAQFNGDVRFKVPGTPDGFVIKVQSQYSRSSIFGNTLQDICYGAIPSSSMLQQRSSSERPRYNFNIQGLARYYFNVPVGSLNLSYEFAHTQTRKNSDIMLMEASATDGMAEFSPDLSPEPDYANSYTSKLYKNEHRIKLMWGFDKKYEKGRLQIDFQPDFIFESQHLFYHRGSVDAAPSRSYLKFNIPEATITWRTNDQKQRYWLSYELKQTPVNLVNLVDIRDDVDPLNIVVGNPELKNSTTNIFNLVGIWNPNSKFNHYLNFESKWIRNDIMMGYRYDMQTGVRTTKAYNVSGNYDMDVIYNINYSFGQSNRFSVYNFFQGNVQRYANMIGNDSEPTKQTVDNRGLEEHIGFRYSEKGKLGMRLSGRISYNNSKSSGIMPVKNHNGYAGGDFYCWMILPYNLSFNTDLIAMKRYGYLENSMNSWTCIWDAEIGYSIKNGVWRFTISAKDILNQAKGLQYSVNASGRTQTLSTVLPRYLMLKIHYRFDFKPKRSQH